jgi:CDP-diacylglycerol--glycerol-3-phosphate 3-phosphatidyltransferase
VGITPNTLTTLGALLIVGAGAAFGVGSLRLGGALLLASGVVDTLDGQVARLFGQESKFGAFYDSTLDRVGDGAIFIGLAVYLRAAPDVDWREASVLVCLVALLATQLVSYMRARAEGLGLECKVGIAQRAERILGLGLPTLLFGAGPGARLLTIIVTILMVLSIVTVGQRFVHVYRTAPTAGGR